MRVTSGADNRAFPSNPNGSSTENCLGDKPPPCTRREITLFVFTHTIPLSMTFQLLVFANSAKETACLVSLPQSLCIINLRNAGVRETDLILDSFLTGIWGVTGSFLVVSTTGGVHRE